MYAKIVNGSVEQYPYSFDDLKAEYPNTSFPASMPDERLLDFDMVRVVVVGQPVVDYTKNVSEGTPALIDGQWQQVWVVTDASQQEIAERLDAQWAVVRDQRNKLLSGCDWTQVDDAPLTNTQKAQWAAYRQQLRDVPQQADPFNIVWPTPPGA